MIVVMRSAKTTVFENVLLILMKGYDMNNVPIKRMQKTINTTYRATTLK